jgi:hypothetical protein
MVRNLLNKLYAFVSLMAIAILGMPLAFQPIAMHAGAQAAPQAQLPEYKKNTLHLKVVDGVTLAADGTFTGQPASEVQKLNDLLANAKRIKTAKLKQGSAQSALQAKLDVALNNYYKVNFQNDVDMPSLTAQLKSLSIVASAYAEPTAAPSPTASYVSQQNYLTAAPQGIDSNYASTFPGGTGDKVKIYDVEYAWNTAHEDLSKSRTALIANGTPVDPFNDNNHGTAVIGSMVGDSNTYGVTGATAGAALKLVNVNNAERGYDPINALYLAGQTAVPGDIVLIEQQTWGPTPDTYDYVPLEWIDGVYDAIKTLTANGVIVVEAGGNGNQNLDNTTYYGSSFPKGKADSGAIIVGAGANCATSARLSRMSYSNYGTRVNLQGPGECVTTTGYGDLYNTAGANALYTQSFNGTSSASPVVAAAAAALSSAYKTMNGVALSPADVRTYLKQSGTAQNTASGTLTGNIGQYPNLAKALLLTDKVAPSAPLNLKSTASTRSVALSWTASTDNIKVASYRVYRNGALYATVSGTIFTDTNVSKKKTYSYYVVAVDSNNNVSTASNTASIKF